MNPHRRLRLAAWLLAAAVGATGCGGNSSETQLIGNGVSGSGQGVEVTLSEPSGDNTTEVVIDAGPGSGFSLPVANLAYVTVTVCEPGSRTHCATIDHVLLDTGSIGLRVLKSTVAGLSLPAVAAGTGVAHECYPFMVGAVWGPLASADVTIGGRLAPSLPMQLIDDDAVPSPVPPADCRTAAGGDLMQSVASLQARGVLGIGLLRHDCGLNCQLGRYDSGVTMYYSCQAGSCQATALAPDSQVQHPVPAFSEDNNGTVVVLPVLPVLGAAKVRGRLVFGIGTKANNQLPVGSQVLPLETDPNRATYLYLTTTLGGVTFPNAYVDSGSNGLFFDDPAAMSLCAAPVAGEGQWFCPSIQQSRVATLIGADGNTAVANFDVISANALFATSNSAFATLAGSAGSANPGAFVWGLPFFYGRRVFTSIWGQALAVNGPWYAF